jgi:iron complex outermembrane receptor protein
VINPQISQEKGMNYEIGGTGFWFNNRLQGTLALYQMDIKDLLVAQRVGEDEFIGRNAGQTRHRGMEVSLQYFMHLGRSLNLSPFISYTLNDHNFVDFQTADSDFSGNPLTGVPKNRIYGGLQLNSDFGWFWNTNYQFVDAIPLTDSASLYSDAYSLWNTQLGYRTQWDSKFNLSLEVGINNIFDTLYASSVLINATGFGGSEPRYYYPGNGRNYYVGILVLYAL